jgi:hypothetical protein
MMPKISETDQAGVTVNSHDSLSKQGARAVMFVLFLAVLMALSAIFVIMTNERLGPEAAQRLPPRQDVRSPA